MNAFSLQMIQKIMMFKRSQELVRSVTSSLIKPPMKIKKCGKRLTKVEALTLRLSSAHEFVESVEDRCSMPTSEHIRQTSAKSFCRPKEKVL